MGAVRCRVRQDQEPDIDEIYEFAIKEINGLSLAEDDWQYHVSINHTAMCEHTESIINRRSLGIYYFPEQAASLKNPSKK
ncbi:hypothetical protein ig2599ANME_1574 [groundwater metagenome]